MKELTPAHAEAMAAWAAGLWRGANYHLKEVATRRYRRAILSGEISSRPCSVCGDTDRAHGHHEDYSRPLDVIWLCPIHHSWRHRYHHTVPEMIEFHFSDRPSATTAMDALNRARAAWEKSQPQLFLELEPLEEAPGPQLTGVRGRGTGVSSSGPFPRTSPGSPDRGRSTTHDGGDTAQILGRTARGVPAKGA